MCAGHLQLFTLADGDRRWILEVSIVGVVTGTERIVGSDIAPCPMPRNWRSRDRATACRRSGVPDVDEMRQGPPLMYRPDCQPGRSGFGIWRLDRNWPLTSAGSTGVPVTPVEQRPQAKVLLVRAILSQVFNPFCTCNVLMMVLHSPENLEFRVGEDWAF